MENITNIIIIAIVSSLLLLIFIFFLWRLLRRILRFFKANAKIFGENLEARIISIGIVTIIFPRTISNIIFNIVRFFIDLLLIIPRVINDIFNQALSTDYTSSEQFFRIMFSTLNQMAESVLNIFNNLLRYFPISGFFLALGLWVVIGQLLSLAPQQKLTEDQQGKLSRSRIVRIYQKISKPQRQNILLMIVLLISTYLSIVAIVSVPLIDPRETPVELTTELNNRLEQLKTKEHSKGYTSDEDSQKNPFNELETSLNELKNKINTSSDSWPENKLKSAILKKVDSWFADAWSILKYQKNMRSKSLKKWKIFRVRAQNSKEELLEQARSDFDANTKIPMSNQERVHYYRAVSRWAGKNIDTLNNHLEKCIKNLNLKDENWRFWAGQTKTSLENAINNLIVKGNSQVSSDEPIHSYRWDIPDLFKMYSYSRGSNIFYNDEFLFEIPRDIDDLPPLPEPGLGSGIFGLASMWLLETRSLELVLIVGMLGFGLFGSAVSSFVRGQFSPPDVKVSEKGDQPLVKNLFSVVIRGLSAAVVVFLAVEGGFAIFSTGGTKPNPYVLFFTCLVGAVFSKRVWEKALKYIEKQPADDKIEEKKQRKKEKEKEEQKKT